MAPMFDADHDAMLRALGAPQPLGSAGGERVWPVTVGEVADLLEHNRRVHRDGRQRSEGPTLPEDAVRLMDFELPDLPR